jgi:hypothetical protein
MLALSNTITKENCEDIAEFENTEKYCGGCRETYDTKIEAHCPGCHFIYDIDKKHCCDCTKIWDFRTKYHCVRCCITFDDIMDHCCICKSEYNSKTNKHCCFCHCTGKINENHCCKCRAVWAQKEYYHCNRCCQIFSHTDNHKHKCKCDMCQKDLSDNKYCCYDGIYLMILHFKDFMEMSQLKNKFIISKCLCTCNSMKKFISGIKSIGFDNVFDFLSHRLNYEFVFHGTQNITNAKKICCESWNINFRDGQVHGPGEYFTTNIETAKYYADNNGVIVASIIVTSKRVNIKKVLKENETWFVVNNNKEATFCLPVAILQYRTKIDSYELCIKKEHEE